MEFRSGMIQPSLIDGLKNILDQYPDDNQILKELIQNAEDAGASVVKFLYDKSQYGTDPGKLHDPGLARFQGQALYAYNDAQFSKADWTGIRMIQKSVKKNDPMRVGRFGLGFKSVFHMTDLVGILSGDELGFLDPHERYFETTPDEGERPRPTSSYAWKLGSEELLKIPHQFEPFNQSLFGLSGTIFRFPLRSNAALSKISTTTYTEKKIDTLFEMFKYEAHSFLLFLTNIEKIEIYSKEAKDAEPELLFAVQIDDLCLENTRHHRQDFRKNVSDHWLQQPYHVTYQTATVCTEPKRGQAKKQWLMCHYFEGGSDSLLEGIMQQGQTKLLPWVGICLPLNTQDTAIPRGQVFCFLPLPAEEPSATGFYFHVHGYFAVDQNRRHLKWPSADQRTTEVTDEALRWNVAMVKETLPRAVAKAVQYCIKEKYGPEDVYRLYPDPTLLQGHWADLSPSFYDNIQSECVYYTTEHQGEWLSARQACVVPETEKHRDVITRILLGSDLTSNLVTPPSYVLRCLPQKPKEVTDVILASFLCSGDTQGALDREERSQLVEYFSRSQESIRHLNSLKLCELQNGNVVTFENTCYYDGLDCQTHLTDILPGLRHLFHVQVPRGDPFHEVLHKVATSGLTKLLLVGVRNVPGLLKEMLKDTTGPVKLKQSLSYRGESFSLDDDWFRKLWKHIEIHKEELPLALYETIPLLRSKYGLQMLEKKKSFLAYPKHEENHGDFTSDDIITTAENLGCVFIYDTSEFTHEYVKKFDPEGLLKAWGNVQDCREQTANLTTKERRNLRSFLASSPSLENTYVLETLPIFELLPVLNSKQLEWTSAETTRKGAQWIRGATEELFPLPKGIQIIDLADDRARRLAANVGISCSEVSRIFTDYILVTDAFVEYNAMQKAEIVETILNDFERHMKNPAFASQIKGLQCIPATTGGFQFIESLFDPRDTVICDLFCDSNLVAFPKKQFQCDLMLSKLKQLGMRDSNTVTASELFALASHIDKHGNSGMLCKQGEALALFLDSHTDILQQNITKGPFHESLKSTIWNLKIIPTMTKRPETYSTEIPWLGEQLGLVSPADISTQYKLVGSQCPINIAYKSLADCFQWNKRPELQKVVKHLKCVVESHRFQSGMPQILPAIYGYLQEEINKDTIEYVNDIGKWIWCGDGYVQPKDIVFECDLRVDASPYAYICPPQLLIYQQLLRLAGVQETIDCRDILRKIDQAQSNASNHRPNSKRDHGIVMTIIHHVVDELEKSENKRDLLDGLLIPVHTQDDSLKLMPVANCTFCDSDWLKKGYDKTDVDDLGENVYIIHSDTSEATANLLEVPSFMSRYIDAEEFEMAYGQSEPLTRRIRNILQEYKDGSAVLKELVQNADDAGATEVAFIYDQRDFTNDSKELLDDNMRDLQGPAIWSYNNETFKDDDYKNIVQLSGANKERQTTKIGRFGLGFNAVYHLTDAPSFVSGDNLVIFDPHLKYLGKCVKDKSKPGIKINLHSKPARIKKFQDQFKPFRDIHGWNIDKSFKGTLFRFPLRTRDQAMRSDISEKSYNHEEVMTLFEILHNTAEELLLFTQNVKQITVSVIKNDARSENNPLCLFEISRSFECVLRPMSVDINTRSHPDAEARILHMAEKCLSGESVSKSSHVNGYVLNISLKTKGELSENRSGYFLEATAWGHVKPVIRNSTWLVYGAVGTGAAVAMARDNPHLVPVGGVATRVTRTPHNQYQIVPMTTQGRIFCFLPLPMKNNLPFHTNGYFAITSSRNQLHENETTEKPDERALWNKVLVGDAVCTALISMLEDATKLAAFDQNHLRQNLFNLFPTEIAIESGGRSNAMYELMSRFFSEVFSGTGPSILPCRTTWVNGAHFKALDRHLRESELSNVFTKVCETTLNSEREESFVDLPLFIYSPLESCVSNFTASDHLLNTEQFYKDIFLPNICRHDITDNETLLIHGISDFNGVLDAHFREMECIPVKYTQNRIVYRKPSSLVNPDCHLAELFDLEEGYFPLSLVQERVTIEKEKWRLGLERLGMRDKDLLPNEVLERAKTIHTLSDQNCVKRCRCLLRLLSVMPQSSLNEIESELCTVRFIPKQEKPKSWPLTWAGEGFEQHLTLNEVFDCSDYSFLGSILPVPKQMAEIKPVFERMARNMLELNHVLQQVEIVHTYLCGTNMRVANKRLIDDIMAGCYRLCQSFERGDDNIYNVFNDKPFIWFIDKGLLAKPSKCARQTAFDYTPHLFQLPTGFNYRYENLFNSLRIRHKLEPRDFANVLKDTFDRYGTIAVPQAELSTLFNVIRGFTESINSATDQTLKTDKIQNTVQEYGPIYLPNEEGVLLPSTELSIYTCSWLPVEDAAQMCNSRIAKYDAQCLGARTLEEANLEKYMLGVSFGQHEELTNRINRILESYPCDREILKELLQNADDAGASEIHFVLDERSHKTERIFNESWFHMQGPALLLYNDKPFSEKDITGIQRLGEGSKADDAITTGKYGVGFNCVYHLTDTPTFISSGSEIGERFCVFDPQYKYCPGSSKTHPGRMFEVGEKLRKNFEDVFECYDLSEFISLKSEYALFRFPLRTQEIANSSVFGKKEVTTTNILDLFDKFKDEMSLALLFLPHVRSISLSKINKSGNFERILSTKAHLTSGQESHAAYREALMTAAASLRDKKTTLEEIPVTQSPYEMTTTTLSESTAICQEWILCQRIGFSSSSAVPESIKQQYKEHNAAVLPRGGVAYCLSESTTLMPSGETKAAQRGDLKTEKNPRDVTGIFATPKLFCSLPLPQQSYMPMHVNGHFILDSETRHDIYHSDGRYTFRSQWNEMLLSSVIAKAYQSAIEGIKSLLPMNPVHYNDMKMLFIAFLKSFPRRPLAEVRPALQSLQRETYKNIVESKAELIPVLERQQFKNICDNFPGDEIVRIKWKAAAGNNSEVFFWHYEHRYSLQLSKPTTSNKAENEQILKNALLNCRFPLTVLDIELKERFHEAMSILPSNTSATANGEPDDLSSDILKYVSPESVLHFLRTYKENTEVFCLPSNLEATPFLTVEALYATYQYVAETENINRDVNGLPLLLTKDFVLREFSENKQTLVSSYSDLIPEVPEKFMHHVFFQGSEWICRALEDKLGSVVKCMDMRDLAQLLPIHINEEIYKKSSDVIFRENKISPWLVLLYKFLYEKTHIPSSGHAGQLMFIPENIKPIEEWCFVPNISKNKKYLSKLRNSHLIFWQHYSDLDALNKIPVPRIYHVKEGSEEIMKMLCLITASTNRPRELLQTLAEHLNCYSSLTDVLSDCEATGLLLYFNEHLKTIRSLCNASCLLKNLPLYVTCGSEIVMICNVRNVVVLPKGVKHTGLERLHDSNTLFLKQQWGVQELLQYIGCAVPSFEEAYCDFILPNIERLDEKEIYDHVLNIKQYTEKNCSDKEKAKRERLYNQMSAVRFLPKADGKLHTASEFYYVNNEVFRVMQSGDDFPPERYRSFEWLTFLCKIGIRHQITNSMFVDYATIISKTVEHHKVRNMAEVLLTHMFRRTDEENSPSFLSCIGNICFLPRQLVSQKLTAICPVDDTDALISYNKSTLSKNERISWTVLPVLQSFTVPSRTYHRKHLGIIEMPDSEVTMKHLYRIGEHLKWLQIEDQNSVPKFQRIFTECLQFLSERDLCDQELSRLSKIKCIITDDGYFARPNQLARRIEKEWKLHPQICEVPDSFCGVMKFLYKVGTTSEISVEQTASVLDEYGKASKGEKIPPNEWEIAVSAVKLLFTLISEDPN